MDAIKTAAAQQALQDLLMALNTIDVESIWVWFELEYVHLKYAKILKLYQIILNDLKLIYNTMALSVVNML